LDAEEQDILHELKARDQWKQEEAKGREETELERLEHMIKDEEAKASEVQFVENLLDRTHEYDLADGGVGGNVVTENTREWEAANRRAPMDTTEMSDIEIPVYSKETEPNESPLVQQRPN
jgi:hypothetical protein